jgi:RimJ/RimL family protein N-acetyltransferase
MQRSMETIQSADIIIRPFTPDDASEFTAACLESRNTVGHWMPWWHEGYTQEEALTWIATCANKIAAGTSYDVGIFRAEDGLLIGSIAINRLDTLNRIGNIGYWVRESLQGQGYAGKAITLIKEFGFQTLQLVRIELIILEDNVASRSVAERAGAEFECLAKKRLMHQGYARTAAVYSFT